MRLITRSKFGFCKNVTKDFKSMFDEPTFAKLNNRSLILVFGPDARKFLQGITTNNMSQLYEQTNSNQ